jgi:hypothetical protein
VQIGPVRKTVFLSVARRLLSVVQMARRVVMTVQVGWPDQQSDLARRPRALVLAFPYPLLLHYPGDSPSSPVARTQVERAPGEGTRMGIPQMASSLPLEADPVSVRWAKLELATVSPLTMMRSTSRRGYDCDLMIVRGF